MEVISVKIKKRCSIHVFNPMGGAKNYDRRPRYRDGHHNASGLKGAERTSFAPAHTTIMLNTKG